MYALMRHGKVNDFFENNSINQKYFLIKYQKKRLDVIWVIKMPEDTSMPVV